MSDRRGTTRRSVLAAGAAAFALPVMKPFAWAQGKSGLHGLSTFGDLKYQPGFRHFDYLNPDAPKGGRINFQPPYWFYNQNPNTFNTLNGFVLRGDAPPRIGVLFDSLMAGAADEPDSVYGLVAETVAVSEDGNTYTFTLREGPRFHDGSPLTAEDVAFSLMLLKEKGHPNISQVIREMASATAPDPKTVVVTLSGKQNRSTILTIVSLPIFSKAFYTANDFERATLTPPLGSGPYKVGPISAGRYIEFERDPDYWGHDLPVNVGSSNFDRIRIDFYQERQTAFEAFKKGDITFREEFTSITWARDYNFPAVNDGRVKKSLFDAELRPSFQGMFFNTRRPQFADPRTRHAIALAFDFEWSNKNLFYDAYQRLTSYFEKSDFKAEGEPTPAELALLEPHRDQLPPEVFGPAYVPPKTNGSGRDRAILRQASQLLAEAGWKRNGAGLVNEKGERLTIEFLIDAEVFVRALSPYRENLRAIGVDASIRQIDPAQYQSRLNDYNFDIVLMAVSLSPTPLDGLDTLFGSRAADTPGTYNLAGMKEPVVDALIAKVATVASRDELIAITKSIDRILRAKHYWVPAWFQPNHRVAHWDLFGWPPEKPAYAFAPEATWWFDKEKAAAAGKPNG